MQQIERFQLLKRLGAGGFGEVFLGVDPAIGRHVAIKVFRPRDENLIAFDASSDDEGLAILRARFLKEARILASLDDEPHVVGVLEYGELDDGAPYYVMPYLPRSLADELGKDVFDVSALAELPEDKHPRALPLERSLVIIEQILKGLAAAHGRGLVHRDIKPSNIMLSESGQIRLVDFGIAKAPDSQHSTISHLGMGSRNYMAPEQRESAKHVDARADIYAAAMVAYRMLVGKLPIGRFADPNVAVPALGQPLNNLLLVMMAVDKDERPADGAAALRRFQSARASVGQVDAGSDTGTWVGNTGASDIRDELKPLRARIIEVIDAYGTIWPDEREVLQALADIADLDEPGLDKLIESVIAADDKLGMKARLARAVIQRVGIVKGPLSDKVRASLAAPVEACGWSPKDLEQLIDRAVAEQRASERANQASKASSSGSNSKLPLKPILAGLLIVAVLAGGGFGIQQWRQHQIIEAERLAQREAAMAEESQAWRQAERADNIAGYRQYLTLWPEGNHTAEAQARIARLEDQVHRAQMSEAERERELVSTIQDYLNRLGYWVVESGELDTRTEAGIRAFEESHSLPVTGKADGVMQSVLIEEYDRRDQAAWQEASETDTEAAYVSYREQFPHGTFILEVNGRIEAAREMTVAEDERRREAEAETEVQRQLVRAVQAELQRLGRSVDIDGLAGTSTRAQILAFERANQRTPVGEVSQTLLNALKETQRWPSPQPGSRFRDCDSCPEMVVIPAGRFTMGSPASEPDRQDNEGPQREVSVPTFALARTEVTVDDFRHFVEETDYQTEAESNAGGNRGCHVFDGDSWSWRAEASWRSPGYTQGNNHPVVCVSWNDAQAYVRWLVDSTGENYRLPSEAEREYATRAGTTSRFNTGNCITTAQANFNGNHPADGCPHGEYRWRTVSVGSFAANTFGLHDMHGNAWEWIRDCWNESYRGAPTDGSAWMSGDCTHGVLRGGSYINNGQTLRSALRVTDAGDYRGNSTGFRPARTITP